MSVGVYDNLGLSFRFPENWKAIDEQTDAWPRAVSVESPDGGFWALKVFEPTLDPEELATESLRAMRLEYDDLEAERVAEPVGENEAVGFDMNFYCLDLLIAAQTRAFRNPLGSVLLQYQAEDREFDQLKPVFDAITASLLGQGAAAEQ